IYTGWYVIVWSKKGIYIGVGEILLNSNETDGGKDGYQIKLNQAVSNAVSIPVIASGGAGKLEDFHTLFAETNVTSALAASVFHYNEINIKDLKQSLS